MGFAFSPLYISGGIVKKVASVALPTIGFAVAGPIGAAIGGAVGGAVQGGGIKGMLIGGVTGYAGGALAAKGGLSGMFGSAGSGVKSGMTSIGNFFGGGTTSAATSAGSNLIRSLGGTIAPQATFNVGSSLQHLTSGVSGISSSTPQFFQSAAASPSGLGQWSTMVSPIDYSSGGNLSVGGDADRIYQQYQKTKLPGGISKLTEATVAPNIKTGLQFDPSGLGDALTSITGQYQDELAARQLEALQEAAGAYKDEFADHYSRTAKENLAKLDAGELPEQYLATLKRTADEVSRRLTAQGHNPAESGYGRELLERTLVDQEARFFANERSYNTALAGGAAGMNAQMLALQGNLSQAANKNVGAARTQTVRSLLNLGGINTSPIQDKPININLSNLV